VEAIPNEFPYHVALYKYGGYRCGGSIIDAHHVLTAAHCTQNVSVTDMEIVAGEHNRWKLTKELSRGGT